MLARSLLLLAVVWPLSVSAEETPERYPRERVSDIDAWMPLHCRPEVREAFLFIWEECRRGRTSRECAFRIDSIPGSDDVEIVIMGPDTTRDDRNTFRRTVDVKPGRTLAIAHTHPREAESGVGPEDDKVPVSINYILAGGSRGLYAWDRDFGATRRALRSYPKWKEECSQEDLDRSREQLRVLRDRAASGG